MAGPIARRRRLGLVVAFAGTLGVTVASAADVRAEPKTTPSPPSGAEVCKASSLLKKAIGTYRPGGDAPGSFHASSELEIHFPGGGHAARELVEMYAFDAKSPPKVRFEYRGANGVAVAGTNGRKAWSVSPEGTVPYDGGHFFVPARLRDLGAVLLAAKGQAECAGGAEAGRQRLLLTLPKGEMVLLDVDQKTGLVHRYQGESPGTAGKADQIDVTLRAWQQIDGHWVATELDTRVNGKQASKTHTRTVRVGQQLTKNLFEKPIVEADKPTHKL